MPPRTGAEATFSCENVASWHFWTIIITIRDSRNRIYIEGSWEALEHAAKRRDNVFAEIAKTGLGQWSEVNQEQSLTDFKHYENPCRTADLSASKIEIRTDNFSKEQK